MTVLRGGLVVDGTGTPPQRQDVAFRGSEIVAVGELGKTDEDVIDVDGLVVAPGFIDCHTHYDAQVLWDPDLTPSSWHGVTSVVMGNCGFGIAPTAASGRETIARTLENVEGMSFDALMEGIPWTFETFSEYLDAVEACQPALNAAVMVGHTPIRLYVMGEEAAEREATADEVDRMKQVLRDSLHGGAIGFASSRLPSHAGAWGKPVPSRMAALDELFALAEVLKECGPHIVAVTKGPDLGPDVLARLSEATGGPVTWTALTASSDQPEWRSRLEETHLLGGDVWPQIACRPVVVQATLKEPAPLAKVDAFRQALALPVSERHLLYQDAAWRARARADVIRQRPGLWERMYLQDPVAGYEVGHSLHQLAEARGADEVELLCAIALEGRLETRFRIVLGNDEQDGIAQLLHDPRTILGLSDAGAHADQLCDAVFATYLLEHWVRATQTLTLEKAVWRLTGHPAAVFGLEGRGVVKTGYAADLVVFDPDQVGVGPEKRVTDLPAGADRLVADSRGIHGVWVGGVPIRDAKGATGLRAGRVLRGTVS